MTMRIEELWTSLRREAVEAQRRVDAAHPLDLYADFQQPDRPGLILFCNERPNDAPPLKAIGIDRRRRQDGRWSMRVYLEEPRLLPVFAELCRDIIEFTRQAVRSGQPSGLVLSRLERWRSLMQPQLAGLRGAQLRGLIGELLVLDRELLPILGPDQAVSAWTGPLGASQDFHLPDGRKLEVKALDRQADRVQINGLDQLDGGSDPLQLIVVRLEDTGIEAEGAITAARLIARLRAQLCQAPAAQQTFEMLLRFVGWDDDPSLSGWSASTATTWMKASPALLPRPFRPQSRKRHIRSFSHLQQRLHDRRRIPCRSARRGSLTRRGPGLRIEGSFRPGNVGPALRIWRSARRRVVCRGAHGPTWPEVGYRCLGDRRRRRLAPPFCRDLGWQSGISCKHNSHRRKRAGFQSRTRSV